MHHRSIALPLATLATLALASVALAGGWAEVSAKGVPVDPPAGGETTIELNVLQHGVTPVSWPTLTVVATDATSGTVLRTEAQAEGAEGAYVATIVFPSAGQWTLTFDSTELQMGGSVAMNVASAVAAAEPAVVAPAATTFDGMPFVLLLLGAIAALAIGALLFRSRGASTDPQVSVRT